MRDLFGDDYFEKKEKKPKKPTKLFHFPLTFGFQETKHEEGPLDKFIEENQDLLGGQFKQKDKYQLALEENEMLFEERFRPHEVEMAEFDNKHIEKEDAKSIKEDNKKNK